MYGWRDPICIKANSRCRTTWVIARFSAAPARIPDRRAAGSVLDTGRPELASFTYGGGNYLSYSEPIRSPSNRSRVTQVVQASLSEGPYHKNIEAILQVLLLVGGLGLLNCDDCNCCDRKNAPTSPHRVRSIAHRKLFHKSPPVSLVTERLVKFVCVLSRKPCIQGNAHDSSLREICFRGCNQRATNSAAARGTQCDQGKNSPGRIVMLIAWICERANHPANAAIHNRDKGLVGRIRQNQL